MEDTFLPLTGLLPSETICTKRYIRLPSVRTDDLECAVSCNFSGNCVTCPGESHSLPMTLSQAVLEFISRETATPRVAVARLAVSCVKRRAFSAKRPAWRRRRRRAAAAAPTGLSRRRPVWCVRTSPPATTTGSLLATDGPFFPKENLQVYSGGQKVKGQQRIRQGLQRIQFGRR